MTHTKIVRVARATYDVWVVIQCTAHLWRIESVQSCAGETVHLSQSEWEPVLSVLSALAEQGTLLQPL